MGPTPNKEPRARLGDLRERRAQGTAEKGGSRATGGRETPTRSATASGALLPGRRIRGRGDLPGGRCRREAATGGRGAPFALVVAIALLAFASVACGASGQAESVDAKAAQGKGAQERAPAAPATVSETVQEGNGKDRSDVRAGGAGLRVGGSGARAGNVVAGAVEAGSRMGAVNPGERDKAGRGAEGAEGAKVTLRITGDRGTAFSGVCSDGEAERTVEGQAPERYTLEPRGKDVRCEVRNEGGGDLGIVFTGGAGVRSEHRTGGAESTTRFVYLNGGVSSSTSSVAVEQGMARSGGSSEG